MTPYETPEMSEHRSTEDVPKDRELMPLGRKDIRHSALLPE